jgi:hypothetical protein
MLVETILAGCSKTPRYKRIPVTSIHTPALCYGGVYERNLNPPSSPFTKGGNRTYVLPFVKGRKRGFYMAFEPSFLGVTVR